MCQFPVADDAHCYVGSGPTKGPKYHNEKLDSGAGS